MYLKTIDIVGFKSFAEKTRVDLKPGITGIIGPNGCGKSNIMESVRWCIGEMSWKSLRSDSMVSIIFAGTARRNAMNLSEVTLTFDNAQSQLPVQYSEVSVTRRIFRSGESEYYINKTQCRLRDIRELFLDTGIGNTGYAIIDQGGVDFILNSKPEDRRALFEEAAGVSKYKAKRKEALRKLDRVEIDLGRLQDSVTLINEQIKKLDADARKANLYQKYKVELVSMEAGQIIREVSDIDRDAEQEEGRIAPQADRLTEIRTAIDVDEARLASLNLERTEQEQSVVDLSKRASESKSEIGTLEERLKNAKESVKDLEGQLASSRDEIELETQRAAAMEPEFERAHQALERAQADLDSVRTACDAFAEDFSRIDTEKQEAEIRRKDLGDKILASVERGQDNSRRLSDTVTRIGQADYRLKRTGAELEKKKVRVEAMRTLCTNADELLTAQRCAVEDALREVAVVESAASDARVEIGSLSDQILEQHLKISSQKAKIESLELQGQRDPYWVGAHAVVGAELPGILGTVRSLIEVDDAGRSRVEDLLGERLYSVVCADVAAAKSGIEFLQGTGKGRARFLVADALPEVHSDLSSLPSGSRPLVDSVRFHPDHDKVVRFLLGGAFATDTGLYGGHWVCGGAPEGETPRLKLSDIGILRSGLDEMQAVQAGLGQDRKTREDALPGLLEEIASAKKELENRSKDLLALQAEQNERRRSLKGDEEEVGTLEEEAKMFQIQLDESAAEKETFSAALEENRREEGELRKKEGEAIESMNDLREMVAGKRVEKDHLEKSLETSTAHRDVMKSQVDGLEVNKKALVDSIERHRERQARCNTRIEELMNLDRESTARLDEVHTALAVLEKESLVQAEKLQKMQVESQEVGTNLHQRKADADGLQAELHSSQMKVAQFKTRREFLLGRLQGEWELSFEEAKEKYEAQPVDQERVEFLRRRIAALGHVNMAAPEEYEQLAGKRDQLQGQIDDLLNAKKDLHSVIAKINATTRENFRQTFTEVREHFRALYGTLFEGGEADVILTEKDNMLESGVDIVAQPPGKKLQSISQLSGGEKTLTAIALLFAFFMVKPSPMCMLDEADAALDDANVERFVSLIREFRDKSQFLIVSHNKLTMEACDAIYGVTMEESGVSQLISVDFKKHEDQGAVRGKPVASTV